MRRRPLLTVTLVATLLTVAIALPVLESPGQRILGNEIVGRHPDAYMSIAAFETAELSAKTQPATDWLGALLAAWIGGVAAFNVVVLATFPLTAVFAYLLARHLEIPPPYAAFAALLFAFSPFRLSHATYHPHIVQTQWIPLYFLALWQCLDRWSYRRAAGLFGATALVALSNFYAGYFAAALTPLVVIAYWWAAPKVPVREARNLWLTSGMLAAAAALAAIWPAFVFSNLSLSMDRLGRPAHDLFLYGTRWWSYVVPPVEHPVMGRLAQAIWSREAITDGVVEQQLSLGLAVLVLASVAVVAWCAGERRTVAQKSVPPLVVIAAASLLLSLAPATRDGTLLPLPGRFLYQLAPMFRAFARFGAFFQLMAVLLAAMGLAHLWSRRTSATKAAALILIFAALFENTPYPPARWHDVLPTKAHRWLADQPQPWKVLDCIAEVESQDFVGRLMPGPLQQLGKNTEDCGEPHLPGKLAAEGITHVIVRRGTPEAHHFDAFGLPSGLVEAAAFETALALRVDAAPAPLLVERLEGFSWREYGNGGTYRWMSDRGDIVVANRSGHHLSSQLRLKLQAFAKPREVQVQVGEMAPVSVRLDLEPSVVDLGTIDWPPGSTRISLEPGSPALSPQQLTGSSDRRRLSVALWDWDFGLE